MSGIFESIFRPCFYSEISNDVRFNELNQYVGPTLCGFPPDLRDVDVHVASNGASQPQLWR